MRPPRPRPLTVLSGTLAALSLAVTPALAAQGAGAIGAVAGGVAAPGGGPQTGARTTPSAPTVSQTGARTPTATTPPLSATTTTSTSPAAATPTTAAPSTPTAKSPLTSARPATGATGTHHGSGRLSDGAILAAVIAGLLALACLVWGVFRFTAFEPHWLLSLRHSLAEAGFRASATWSELTDWMRLGH
jgi:hypothetical protein